MEKHEEVYRKLKENGHEGWGGSKYQDRMEGLDKNLKRLLEKTQLKSGRMLELGSGAGDVSIWFAKRGFETYGVEISETAVEWAREKAGDLKCEFLHSSVTVPLNFHQEFDLVVDGNCLHCLFDSDRNKFYENTKSALKEEGYLYIASVIANNEGETAVVGPIPRCFLTRDVLVDEIEAYGYDLKYEWVNTHENHSHFIGIFKLMNKY